MCATGNHRLCSLSALLLVLVAQTIHVEYARADYENTWNLYYEPPCCTGSAAGHHLRHHKGKSLQLLRFRALHAIPFRSRIRSQGK